ncbi:MAG: hypothetical protein LBV32_03180 [Tannerellaceae bacterium]|jgi:hypothetical protein|nr:hypothetical protein [Tannerellaceae bacterium]
MADEFDIIDLVFAAVESADTGLVLYKDYSATGEKNDHITVRTTGMETKEYVNKASVVNVNVFIRRRDNNGMAYRDVMRNAKRKLITSFKSISHPAGMYFRAKVVWAEPMGEAKAGFDCTNIRLEVITELN